MREKFNWEEFIDRSLVVNCKTEDELRKFLKICDYLRLSISSDCKNWNKFKSDTCCYYSLFCKAVEICSIKDVSPFVMTIVNWSDYIEQEKSIFETIAEYIGMKIDEEFKIGDLIYRINNEEGLQYLCDSKWYYSQCLNKILTGELKIIKEPEFKVGDRFKLDDRIEIQSCINGVVYFVKRDNRVHINLMCIIDEINNKLYRVKCDGIQLASKPLFLYFTKEELSKLKRI